MLQGLFEKFLPKLGEFLKKKNATARTVAFCRVKCHPV